MKNINQINNILTATAFTLLVVSASAQGQGQMMAATTAILRVVITLIAGAVSRIRQRLGRSLMPSHIWGVHSEHHAFVQQFIATRQTMNSSCYPPCTGSR